MSKMTRINFGVCPTTDWTMVTFPETITWHTAEREVLKITKTLTSRYIVTVNGIKIEDGPEALWLKLKWT